MPTPDIHRALCIETEPTNQAVVQSSCHWHTLAIKSERDYKWLGFRSCDFEPDLIPAPSLTVRKPQLMFSYLSGTKFW